MVDNHIADPDVEARAPEVDAERERLIAERAARREARLAALAPRQEPEPHLVAGTASPAEAGPTDIAPVVHTETVTVLQRTTDKAPASLGLFVLRLVTAGILAIHGLYHLLNLPATTEMIQSTVLPLAGVMAVVLGIAEVAIAIALLFGLLTRIAGLGIILVAGGALGFVLWGPWSLFTPGQIGITGELELLLVGVGVLFLLVGGGGWSVDRGFRSRRQAAKAA